MVSMTGFGRHSAQVGDCLVIAEVKTLNHRYLDIKLKLPSALMALELNFRHLIQQYFNRGVVELYVRVKRVRGQRNRPLLVSHLAIDEEAFQKYYRQLKGLFQKLGIHSDLPVEGILSHYGVVSFFEELSSSQALIKELEAVVLKAVRKCLNVRKSEGSQLKRILMGHVADLEKVASRIQSLVPKQQAYIRGQLKKKLKKYQGVFEGDWNKIGHEAILQVERGDIEEEINRFLHHIKSLKKLLSSGSKQSIGRELDFVLQEVFRELNTIGSKTGLVDITRCVIEGKRIAEQLRQQGQNVE